MRAAAAWSNRELPGDACDDLIRQLRGFGNANLVFLFATSAYGEEIREIAQRLRTALGDAHVLGGSTTGVIDVHGEHEDQPGIGALALADVQCAVKLAFDAASVRDLLAQPGFALVLPDPRRLEVSVLEAIATAPADVAGGGIAGDGQALFALADSAAGEGGCAIARLGGCGIQLAVAQGAEPSTPFMKVTRARRNALLELDGRPAAEHLADHVRSSPGGTDQLANLLFVALRGPGEPSFEVRPIVGVEGPSGAVVLPDNVPEGAEVAFAMRETLGAMRALHDALAAVSQDGPARAALYFNCAGRGQRLHLEPDADLVAIRRALPGVPLLGMTSSFELARAGERNRMLMYSGVLVVFRDG